MSTSPSAPRRPLAPRAAYALPAVVICLSLYASSAPSPLYDLYRQMWGFSPAVLTLIYATYAAGVLVTLLLAGRVSDEIGRRPVLLAALVGIMASAVLYAVAEAVVWLFVARAVQGLATGLALSAASAALFDLHPRRDPVSVGLANGVASASGAGLGILVSAALVELAPAPRVLTYAVQFVLLAVTTLATLRLQDPVTRAPGARVRLTPQRPRIHAGTGRAFLLASLAVLASWSIFGLFLALGPDLAARVLHTESLLVNGVVIFLLPLAAAVTQLLFGRGAPWAGASFGSLGLTVGMLLLVVSVALSVPAMFVVACVVTGAGFGVTFLGGLRALSSVVPHEHRGAVMSAFYVVAYVALSVPAIVAGFVVAHLGLTLTFEIFGSVIAALALGVAWEAWRTRPARKAADAPAETAGEAAPPAGEVTPTPLEAEAAGVPALAANGTGDCVGHGTVNGVAAGTVAAAVAAGGQRDPRADADTAPIPVVATAGQTLPAQTLPADGPAIEGVVRRVDGAGLPGAVVTVTEPTGRQAAHTTSDQGGEYHVGVPTDSTYLVVTASGFQSHAAMVAVADRAVRHDVTLAGGVGLRGTVHVIDAEGDIRPVSGIAVTLIDVQGTVSAATVSDELGRYLLAGILNGQYTLTAAGTGYQPVATSVVLPGGSEVVQDVELSRRARLLGTVVAGSTGRGVPQALATLIDPSGKVVGSTVTDADGTFAFDDLAEGTYTITASGYAPTASVVQVTAGGASTTEIAFAAPVAGPTPATPAQTETEAGAGPAVNGTPPADAVPEEPGSPTRGRLR